MARDNVNSGNDSRELTGFTAEIYEWLEAIAFALAIVVLLFTFVFRVVGVSGSSMESTLYNGDRLLINSLFYKPERGDVVIAVTDNEYTEGPLVKRVIGIAGDKIEYDASTGAVTVNGERLDETAYIDDENIGGKSSSFDGVDSVTVPEGYVFLMGDNRRISFDSRDKRLGAISEDDILGKVIFRIYPFGNVGKLRG